MGDLVNNFICPRGPDKWFGVLVIAANVFFYGIYQFRNTSKYTPANPLPRDFPEPSFY
jgi:hypothetical protein